MCVVLTRSILMPTINNTLLNTINGPLPPVN